MEDFQGIQFFSHADKFDRFLCDRLDRKGCASSGIAIHFGEDDPVDSQPLVEVLGDFTAS
jgi:hypothetical protein